MGSLCATVSIQMEHSSFIPLARMETTTGAIPPQQTKVSRSHRSEDVTRPSRFCGCEDAIWSGPNRPHRGKSRRTIKRCLPGAVLGPVRTPLPNVTISHPQTDPAPTRLGEAVCKALHRLHFSL